MRYTDYDSDASEQQSEDSDVSSAGPARRGRASQKGKARTSKVRTLNRWTADEHDKLAYLVDKWGSEKNWAKVAEEMPGRTGKQCRERWLNHMKPGIIKGNWSQEEEFLLAQCHALVGSHWSKMTKRLPGRTENSIKNFWNATLRSKAPNKKRGMLWTYMQLHDAKSDDNTVALVTAITRLHDTRELPPHLLGQLDAELLDQRAWKAVLKLEKDFLENSGGDLHHLALPHPSAARDADACAPDHEQQAFAAASAGAVHDQHNGLELGGCGALDGSFLPPHPSDGRCSSQPYAPQQHLLQGMLLDQAAQPQGAAAAWPGHLAAAADGPDTLMPHIQCGGQAEARGVAAAGCGPGALGNQLQQQQVSVLSFELQQHFPPQPPCLAVEAEQPVFGRCWGSYQQGSNEPQHIQQAPAAYAGGSSSSSQSRAPQPRLGCKAPGDADIAASPELPYTSQPSLAPAGLQAKEEHQLPSSSAAGCHSDQNAELRQRSRSSPRADHSRQDNSAAASSRRRLTPAAGAGSSVAGGHGPTCSCGPCVNSRKLHGLHSPGARRQNKNAGQISGGSSGGSSTTRLRGGKSQAAGSEHSGFPPAKVQRTQWPRPQAGGGGGVAGQRCISMCNSLAAQASERAVGALAPQAPCAAGGSASAGATSSYGVGHALGAVAPAAGLSVADGAAGYGMQPGPVLQQHVGEQPYAPAAGWEGVLAAEPPAAGGPRPPVIAPEQDVLPLLPGTEAVAAEAFDCLPWLDRLAVQQQQQQQQHQQQQQAPALEPPAAHRQPLQLPQARDLPFIPGPPSMQAALGPGVIGGGQLSARRSRQQGLDLSLALASPIAIRLGLPAGALEGMGGAADQLHRVSVGQDLGFYVPHSCRQGVRLPSFGQIIMQRASASTLDWDWEALLQADTTGRVARGAEAGEAAAAYRGAAAGLAVAGVKRARVSLTSVDDDAALLIDSVAGDGQALYSHAGVHWDC